MTTPAQETVDRLKPYVLDLLGTDARDQAQQALAETEAIRDAFPDQIDSELDARVPALIDASLDEHAAATAGTVAGWTADAVGGRNLVPNSDFTLPNFPTPWQKEPLVNTDPDGTKYTSQNYGWGVELWFKVEPGIYTLTLDARDVQGRSASRVRASISFRDSADELFGQNSLSSGSLTTTFQRQELRIEVPAGAVQMRLFLLNTDANPGNSYLDFTRIKLERGPRATPWTPAPEDAAEYVQAGSPLSSFPSPLLAHDPGLALRVDNSVGTRVFVGDTMIHGDTGVRNITGDVTNGWTARSATIRREGNTVELRVDGLNAASAVGNTFIYLPAEFAAGPGNTCTYTVSHDGKHDPIAKASLGDTTGTNNHIIRASVTTRFTSGSLSLIYLTNQPWPTTLPGTPA